MLALISAISPLRWLALRKSITRHQLGVYGGVGYSLPVIDHLNDQSFFRVGLAAALPDEEGYYPWLVFAYYKMGLEQTSFTKRPDEDVEQLRGIAVGISTPSMIITFEYRLAEEGGSGLLIFMVGIWAAICQN